MSWLIRRPKNLGNIVAEVGYYQPDGRWYTYSEHFSDEAAADQCARLNGAGQAHPEHPMSRPHDRIRGW